MKFLNDSMPWATIMTAVLVAIAAIAGAVVVIVNPDSLSFHQYLDILKSFAVAVGIVGVGRGITSHGKQTARAALLNDGSLSAQAGAGNGQQPVAAGNGFPAAGADDPYADIAWAEAPPPPGS